MSNRIQRAFQSIHAEESLKDSTRNFIFHKTNGYRNHIRFQFSRLIPVVACIILLIVLGCYQSFFTSTSIISIDINPSLELGINRFEKVIWVKGYNPEGELLADSLEINYLNYQDALEQVLSQEEFTSKQNEPVSIAVASSNQSQQEEILSQIQSCTVERKNTFCYSAQWDNVSEAHASGLSCGKYQAFLILKSLDPTVTLEQVQTMTMQQIHSQIQSLSPSDQPQNSHGTGNGHKGNAGHSGTQNNGQHGKRERE